MIPLRDENPSRVVPALTIGLIALNVLVFVYELALGPEIRGVFFEWGLVPERVTLALRYHQEALGPALWPVLTSMFLHGGWMHLIGNMWYLWIFGDNVEDRLGHAGYLVFFLAAGCFAAALHWALNAHSEAPTVGASGAIAGVLGAYAVAWPRARILTLLPFFPFIQIVPLPALLVLGLWFLWQFLSGALTLGISSAGGGVAFWAHVGGFAFGALVMAALGGAARRRRSGAGALPE